MSYKYVCRDYSLYCEEFKRGVVNLENGHNEVALECFQLAYESVNNSDIYHNKYASFCGFLRMQNGDYGGLILCRDAARTEDIDADVFLNLARAEWCMNNRKKTVDAIYYGLSIDKRHPGLRQMRQDIGVRKRNPIPALGRKNVLNVMIGKILRKKTRPPV